MLFGSTDCKVILSGTLSSGELPSLSSHMEMLMLMLMPLILAGSAAAQDCGTLAKDILTAGPHEAAPMFLQLAQCDAGSAKKVAPTVIPNLIGESDGFDAAVAAIEVGAGSSVMDWMGTLQRDEQSRAVRSYGKKCQESEAVQGFLVGAAADMGDEFWTQRWYRALTECRATSTTKLLVDRVEAGAGEDRGQGGGAHDAAGGGAGAL